MTRSGFLKWRGASQKKRLQTGHAAANEVTAIGGGSDASFIKTYHLQNPGQIVTSPFSSLNHNSLNNEQAINVSNFANYY